MADRKRIGLVFSYNEDWIAGSYYILNIIHALTTLKEEDKPTIVVLTETLQNFSKIKEETNYPYLEHSVFPIPKKRLSVIEKGINKISNSVLQKQIIGNKKNNFPELDFVYPKQINVLSDDLPKVNWVPDFQDIHYPQYFSKEEIENRKQLRNQIIAQGDVVVLSSNDAKADYESLVPNSKAKPFVMPFAVTHPDFLSEDFNNLKEKYSLQSDYFFAPNQFWAHKNHIVILKAVKRLKDKGITVLIAMSGKENDYRNEDNFKFLKDYIETNNIGDCIKFLGFIPRTEQLCLFKNAIAIIQPSKFEGWSTVVEDSKSLNKHIILSNINVHKEQVNTNVTFFNPDDDLALANIIEKMSIEHPVSTPIDYNKNIIEFALKFKTLFNLNV